MILYLSEIYEDETMFSYLSRAYEKGGYISQIQALGEFLKIRMREDWNLYFAIICLQRLLII